jgi:hypothetical protein
VIVVGMLNTFAALASATTLFFGLLIHRLRRRICGCVDKKLAVLGRQVQGSGHGESPGGAEGLPRGPSTPSRDGCDEVAAGAAISSS